MRIAFLERLVLQQIIVLVQHFTALLTVYIIFFYSVHVWMLLRTLVTTMWRLFDASGLFLHGLFCIYFIYYLLIAMSF